MTTDRILNFPHPATSAVNGDDALLGPSPAIARVWSQIHRVAPHFRAAIITGEPGTGAESAARSMHALSPVSHLPFVSLDPEQADSVFSLSSIQNPECEGLIFLSEVDRLAPAAQRGLLRRFRMRGRVPFRVIASPRHELRASVSAGRFAPELAELLGTVRITLPPLRERRQDLPLLATHFARSVAERLGLRAPTLTAGFQEAVSTFGWPGNLTQLQQIFEHLLTETTADVLTADHFAQASRTSSTPNAQSSSPTRMVRLDDIVQEHIRAVLIACQGNKLRAAEILGISRSTLYRMLDGAPANRAYPLAG